MAIKRPAACATSNASSRLVDIITTAASTLSRNDLMRLACASPAMARAVQIAIQKLPVRLSVVLPIYNAHGVGLSIAVRDVLKQTGQCCPPFEVLAVDDGSSDGGRVWLAALAAALGSRGQVLWSDHGLNPLPPNQSFSEHSAPSMAREAEHIEPAAAGDASSGKKRASVVATVDDEHSLGGRVGADHLPHASMRGISTNVDAAESTNDDGAPTVLLPEMVAAEASECLVHLRVLSTVPGARGQGAAMDVALQNARGEYVALMESDDTRPTHAFATLFAALTPQNKDTTSNAAAAVATTGSTAQAPAQNNPSRRTSKVAEWRGYVDAVCSEIELVDDSIELRDDVDSLLNHNSPACSAARHSNEKDALRQMQRARAVGEKWVGMHRYLAWQNALTSPAALAQNRFVEIPALHQTCLYLRALAIELGGYNAHPKWPVDMDFWMRFFAKGHTAGKVGAQDPIPSVAPEIAATIATTTTTTGALYGWRMHAGQGTRNSGRCSTENLRLCKAFYLAQDPAGPAHGRHVQVISCGETLDAWVSALQATNSCASVTAVHWDTKQSPELRLENDHTDDGGDAAVVVNGAMAAEKAEVKEAKGGKKSASSSSSWPLPLHEASSGLRFLRVFVYGMEKVRRRARATVGKQWNPEHDWFAA